MFFYFEIKVIFCQMRQKLDKKSKEELTKKPNERFNFLINLFN
ncbi:MAG: hypothetical protein ACD_11C00021G0024 [uncultured bacterium]|nr:MAG: hypothetical protein ACD_11C00021G0024 [uncultured bacterium]